MRRLLIGVAAALALSAGVCAPAGAAGWQKGTAGNDRVDLGGGADRYRALAGDDRVRGGNGADRVDGGAGADRLRGDAGPDRLRGGAGADVLHARDGIADRKIEGGPGRDVCRVDAGERSLARCEVVRASGEQPPPVDPPVDPPPGPEPQLSDAFVNRNWQPTPYDTCSKELHDSYAVVGPDGKLYPTWHPPTVIDPATGERCTFGHEHGADPADSDIVGWVAGHHAAPGFEDRAGLPFGYVSEELAEYAQGNPGVATRFEDHVGHKVEYANDVRLLDENGDFVNAPAQGGGSVRVECDYLMKVHQGSHSPDATANNAHELLYAARCNDGTELISTTMARFGDANEFNRSCAPGTIVDNGSSSPYPDGGGLRLIPDRGCIEQYVLVSPSNPSAYSDIWALYENWQSENELLTADGELLAAFDPWFAVRNPSRYQTPGGIGRTLDAAWETDSGDGGYANRAPWTDVSSLGPFEFRDPRSPFDGAERDFYVRETEVRNEGGAQRWYTDPYGENASTQPFPGAICQLVAPVDNSAQPELKRRLFGRDADYGGGGTVHAPN